MAIKRQYLRERLNFVPEFDGPLSGWAYNHAMRNLWRVQPDYDIDDMMGEARLAFVKCTHSYPGVIDVKHFAALFRTTYQNQVTTLANRRRKRVGIAYSALGGEIIEEWFQHNVPDEQDAGTAEAELAVMKDEAPPHIRRLITKLVDGPSETNLTPRPVYRQVRHFRQRETDNEFLCRLAEKNPQKCEMLTEVLTWLRGK